MKANMWSGRLSTSSGRTKKPSVPGPMLSTPFSVARAGSARQAAMARGTASGSPGRRIGFMVELIVIVGGRLLDMALAAPYK
ncbi:hypothetical protein D3C85_1516480 [compost metagenome]